MSNTLLDSLYGLLTHITEDCRAHGLVELPENIWESLNKATTSLGNHLDKDLEVDNHPKY